MQNYIKDLISAAQEMRKKAHAPYSKYKVGAAVLTKTGNIIGGCNIESSSYGLTCCAERVALFRSIAEGYKQFVALAVATETGGSPCGACRQIIWELCGEIPIYVIDSSGRTSAFTSSELLPKPFDENDLCI